MATLEDGEALFAAVCERGLEGIVAKLRSEPYRSGERAWVKVKNRAYWRYRLSSPLHESDHASA